MSRSDAMSLLGVCCVALFAYAVWPAACLLVFGVAALANSVLQPSERADGS